MDKFSLAPAGVVVLLVGFVAGDMGAQVSENKIKSLPVLPSRADYSIPSPIHLHLDLLLRFTVISYSVGTGADLASGMVWAFPTSIPTTVTAFIAIHPQATGPPLQKPFCCSSVASINSAGATAFGQVSSSPLRHRSSSPLRLCCVWTPPQWAYFILQCGDGRWLLGRRDPPCPGHVAQLGLLHWTVSGHACTRGLHACLVCSRRSKTSRAKPLAVNKEATRLVHSSKLGPPNHCRLSAASSSKQSGQLSSIAPTTY
ncbi:unnamed protein product [Urochloa humidicola]